MSDRVRFLGLWREKKRRKTRLVEDREMAPNGPPCPARESGLNLKRPKWSAVGFTKPYCK